VFFDGPTGNVLAHFESKPIAAVQSFIAGIHFVQFDNWLLRWLYFGGGLAGCVMILTGFLFWLESRRAEHAREGRIGVRLVEALATGSVTGIILSTLAFFAANRCLPEGASLWGFSREKLEMLVFYAAWLATFGHAFFRVRAAWAEQCALIAGLALIVPPLNWVTTGDHPLRALSRGAYAVAGMDLVLLGFSGLAFVTARRLSREKSARRVGSARVSRTPRAAAPAESKPAHG
jgi:hypothetical protein